MLLGLQDYVLLDRKERDRHEGVEKRRRNQRGIRGTREKSCRKIARDRKREEKREREREREKKREEGGDHFNTLLPSDQRSCSDGLKSDDAIYLCKVNIKKAKHEIAHFIIV